MAKKDRNNGALKTTWKRVIGVITGAAALISAGFGVGKYYADTLNKLERLQVEFQYQQKIREEIDRCQELRDAEARKTVLDLKAVVEQLQTKAYEKK